MSQAGEFWEDLLLPEVRDTGNVPRVFRVVSRHGRPFLLLPQNGLAAAEALSLYPAQTKSARRARAGLRFLLRWRLPAGLPKARLALSTDDSFMRFLAEQTDDPVRALPDFGVLAGNAASPSQRFVLILFDRRGRPRAVVKAGLTEGARALVRRESEFLRGLGGAVQGVPRIRGEATLPRLCALALDYYAGDTPPLECYNEVSSVLGAWLQPGKPGRLEERAPWRELATAAGQLPLFHVLARELGLRPVAGTLFHGDFTPWNIKVGKNKGWTVLDWERGQANGVPGWDWCHYVVQPAILVKGLELRGLKDNADKLLRSFLFRDYIGKAGLQHKGREILLSYLLYCIHVLKPSEGLRQNRQLLEALTEDWRPGSAE